jgi:hypothetical protein
MLSFAVAFGAYKPYYQGFNLSSLGDSPQNPTLFDLIFEDTNNKLSAAKSRIAGRQINHKFQNHKQTELLS